ncbi:hypothetical protein GLE_3337 [Lysobacter enzymogenes]|uniref:Uncharacterized protein n=1 Tax=Lysobacter enzymogenes TaxID=69 RepID=A0A0S2DJ64_LYSEN|nr:HEAT repeat domain-containing protein [Lysobacter enzymogenes]ALN58683.1 hypothetical protein GLE_3337 [Lysobacter enzymogenes]QCW27003.1 hypothetical protein FE772_16505 [Lysobacter enzymogenes]
MTADAIPIIVHQHAEDAAFYWRQFQDNALSSQFRPIDLDAIGKLADGNLEGLRVNGDVGWERALAELERWGGAAEAFVCTALAFDAMERRDHSRWQRLRAAADGGECERGMHAACAWLDLAPIRASLEAWLDTETGLERAIALSALASHRRDAGAALASQFDHRDARVRAAAALHAGRLRREDARGPLAALLDDPETAVRREAAYALGLLQDPRAPLALEGLVEPTSALPDPLLALWAVITPRDQVRERIADWLTRADTQANAVQAARYSGDPYWLPRLVEAAAAPGLGGLAADVFCHLTGAAPERDALFPRDPVRVPAHDHDHDADDAPEPADRDSNEEELVFGWDLPVLDVDALAVWLHAHGNDLIAQERLILGQPAHADYALALLNDANQAARHHAALVLAATGAGALFDVTLPLRRQRQALTPR